MGQSFIGRLVYLQNTNFPYLVNFRRKVFIGTLKISERPFPPPLS